VDPAVFVREFLNGFLETQFVNGLIPTGEYYDLLVSLQKYTTLTDISRRLFVKSPHAVYFEGFADLRLIYLPELDGGEFPFLQGLAQPSSSQKRKLTCFVGHRFLPSIERSLRFNLRHLFEPHGIDLCWSGYDLAAKDIFREIVSGIRSADLCFF